eukprot:tig00000808_g4406.t1
MASAPPPGLRESRPVRLVEASSAAAGCPAENLLTASDEDLWLSAESVPQSITFEFTEPGPEIHTFAFFCWHGYWTNVRSAKILVSGDLLSFRSVCRVEADMRPGWQCFGLAEPIAGDARYVRILVQDNFGGQQVYMNRVAFLAEDVTEARALLNAFTPAGSPERAPPPPGQSAGPGGAGQRGPESPRDTLLEYLASGPGSAAGPDGSFLSAASRGETDDALARALRHAPSPRAQAPPPRPAAHRYSGPGPRSEARSASATGSASASGSASLSASASGSAAGSAEPEIPSAVYDSLFDALRSPAPPSGPIPAREPPLESPRQGPQQPGARASETTPLPHRSPQHRTGPATYGTPPPAPRPPVPAMALPAPPPPPFAGQEDGSAPEPAPPAPPPSPGRMLRAQQRAGLAQSSPSPVAVVDAALALARGQASPAGPRPARPFSRPRRPCRSPSSAQPPARRPCRPSRRACRRPSPVPAPSLAQSPCPSGPAAPWARPPPRAARLPLVAALRRAAALRRRRRRRRPPARPRPEDLAWAASTARASAASPRSSPIPSPRPSTRATPPPRPPPAAGAARPLPGGAEEMRPWPGPEVSPPVTIASPGPAPRSASTGVPSSVRTRAYAPASPPAPAEAARDLHRSAAYDYAEGTAASRRTARANLCERCPRDALPGPRHRLGARVARGRVGGRLGATEGSSAAGSPAAPPEALFLPGRGAGGRDQLLLLRGRSPPDGSPPDASAPRGRSRSAGREAPETVERIWRPDRGGVRERSRSRGRRQRQNPEPEPEPELQPGQPQPEPASQGKRRAAQEDGPESRAQSDSEEREDGRGQRCPRRPQVEGRAEQREGGVPVLRAGPLALAPALAAGRRLLGYDLAGLPEGGPALHSPPESILGRREHHARSRHHRPDRRPAPAAAPPRAAPPASTVSPARRATRGRAVISPPPQPLPAVPLEPPRADPAVERAWRDRARIEQLRGKLAEMQIKIRELSAAGRGRREADEESSLASWSAASEAAPRLPSQRRRAPPAAAPGARQGRAGPLLTSSEIELANCQAEVLPPALGRPLACAGPTRGGADGGGGGGGGGDAGPGGGLRGRAARPPAELAALKAAPRPAPAPPRLGGPRASSTSPSTPSRIAPPSTLLTAPPPRCPAPAPAAPPPPPPPPPPPLQPQPQQRAPALAWPEAEVRWSAPERPWRPAEAARAHYAEPPPPASFAGLPAPSGAPHEAPWGGEAWPSARGSRSGREEAGGGSEGGSWVSGAARLPEAERRRLDGAIESLYASLRAKLHRADRRARSAERRASEAATQTAPAVSIAVQTSSAAARAATPARSSSRPRSTGRTSAGPAPAPAASVPAWRPAAKATCSRHRHHHEPKAAEAARKPAPRPSSSSAPERERQWTVMGDPVRAAPPPTPEMVAAAAMAAYQRDARREGTSGAGRPYTVVVREHR